MPLHTIKITSPCRVVEEEMVFTAVAHVPRKGEDFVDQDGAVWKVTSVSTRYNKRDTDMLGQFKTYDIVSDVWVDDE